MKDFVWEKSKTEMPWTLLGCLGSVTAGFGYASSTILLGIVLEIAAGRYKAVAADDIFGNGCVIDPYNAANTSTLHFFGSAMQCQMGPACKSARMPKCQSARVPECNSARMPECQSGQSGKVEECKNVGVPE